MGDIDDDVGNRKARLPSEADVLRRANEKLQARLAKLDLAQLGRAMKAGRNRRSVPRKHHRQASGGSIVRRGKKLYMRYVDADGTERMRLARGATTIDEARPMLAEVMRRVMRGELGVPEVSDEDKARRRITVKELGAKFLDERDGYSNPKIKDIAEYRRQAKSKLEVRVYPRIGGRAVAGLDVSDVERLRDELLKSKQDGGAALEPASVTLTIAVLSKMFNWAIRRKLIAGPNPVVGCIRPSSEHSIDFLDKEEVARLLAADVGDGTRAMIAAAVYTGARKGELFGLAWRDVHLELGRLDLKHSYAGRTKSGKARPIPLHPELARVLREWKQACPATPEGLVFPVVDGATVRMGGEYDTLRLGEILTANKCHHPADGHPWHMLRHTFASHFMMAGGNILTLQKLLGHATLAMTCRYAHLSPDHLAGEVARMSFAVPVAGVADLCKARREREINATAE